MSLPGADELFRATSSSTTAAAAPTPVVADATTPAPTVLRTRPAARDQSRRPTRRERHDEKITVYVSAEELVELERARLTLRADHGLAVDRGRVVREALAVVLADLEAKGTDSILVRRLHEA